MGYAKTRWAYFPWSFFVVAAASPLTGVVGGLPIAIISGNGGGIPVFYILSCIILMTFAVGFIAMSRYVNNAGAFYTYISKGLGDHWGASASVLALMAYASIQVAIVAMLGFFYSAVFGGACRFASSLVDAEHGIYGDCLGAGHQAG
ncbi:hypothetical protein DZS_49220 [Dickeya ananatis]